MATAQQLVPLFRTAIADVLRDKPSAADQVMFALDRVRREWITPENIHADFEPTPPTEPPLERV